jgi:hypothetical protein
MEFFRLGGSQRPSELSMSISTRDSFKEA